MKHDDPFTSDTGIGEDIPIQIIIVSRKAEFNFDFWLVLINNVAFTLK